MALAPATASPRLPQSPEVILAATSRIVMDVRKREKLQEDRRTEPRWTIHQPVRVTALGADEVTFDPEGRPTLTAFLRDISSVGVGLLHAKAFDTARVLLSFPLIGGDVVRVIIQIKWSCSIGGFGHASGGTIVAAHCPTPNEK